MAKKKSVSVLRQNYFSKLKFKKFYLPKSVFRGKRVIEIFSYSQKAFNLGSKFKWQKMPFSFFRLSNFTSLTQPYRKIIFRSKSYGFVNENTLKGFRRLVAPFFRGKKMKKISAQYYNVFSTYSFTKKPSAIRIGGGVGKKPSSSGLFVKPGQPILTVYTKTPKPILKRLNSLRKKFSPIIFVNFYLFDSFLNYMIFKNSKIRIVDNTGAKLLKYIGSYKFNNVSKKVGSIFITSLKKVAPRRKLKKGALFRAFTIRVRFPVYRPEGVFISASANRAILFKGAENSPITNRLHGYVILEVFYNPLIPFPNITVYIV